MNPNDRIYERLRRNLNNQPVGFPATRSGAEIRILKYIFTPVEAQVAAYLTYKPEPLTSIYSRVSHLVASMEALEKLLDGIKNKGGLEYKMLNGEKCYSCAPLVVGMYEFQVNRLTPEFIKDFKKYTGGAAFGMEFLSTALPQMRTIPVSKSIPVKHHISTFDEIRILVNKAEEPFSIIDCICRKKKAMEAKHCKVTDRTETCLGMGSTARMLLECGTGKEIQRHEALAILEMNQKEGLVLQPSNTQQADFVCSCCGCCCGMLAMQKSLPKPLDFWATNFHAEVDANACEGCGICQARCQVGAMAVPGKKQAAVVDLNRCLGCGLCVTFCPKQAIRLVQKDRQTVPPGTREELYDLIMAKKKGRLGKMRIVGKIVLDAFKTKQLHLLRP